MKKVATKGLTPFRRNAICCLSKDENELDAIPRRSLWGFAMRDFSSKTRNALARKGIVVLSSTFVPCEDGSFANGRRAYNVSDNGTAKVWFFAQVMEAAK